MEANHSQSESTTQISRAIIPCWCVWWIREPHCRWKQTTAATAIAAIAKPDGVRVRWRQFGPTRLLLHDIHYCYSLLNELRYDSLRCQCYNVADIPVITEITEQHWFHSDSDWSQSNYQTLQLPRQMFCLSRRWCQDLNLMTVTCYWHGCTVPQSDKRAGRPSQGPVLTKNSNVTVQYSTLYENMIQYDESIDHRKEI